MVSGVFSGRSTQEEGLTMMTMPRPTRRTWEVVCLSAGLLAASVQPSLGQAAQNGGLPAGDGRDLIATACSQCHGLRTIMSMRDGRAGWRLYVYDMVLRGAQLNSREADTVIDYLVKSFGPGVPLTRSTGAKGAAATLLRAGPGKDLVEARCLRCHDL